MRWIAPIGQMLASLVTMVTLIFLIYQALPSSPVDALISRFSQGGAIQRINPEQTAKLREELGLEGNLPQRLSSFLLQLVRGNLGNSLFSTEPVTQLIAHHLIPTLKISFFSMFLTFVGGLGLGFFLANRSRNRISLHWDGLAQVLLCLPPFALGSLLFATPFFNYPILAASCVCSVALFPHLAFQIRDRLMTLHQERFTQVARAKGLSWPQLYRKHLGIACLPTLLSFLPFAWSFFFGTTILIEPIFGVSGLGSLAMQSLRNQDAPVLLGISIFAGCIRLLLSGLRDLIFTLTFKPFLLRNP